MLTEKEYKFCLKDAHKSKIIYDLAKIFPRKNNLD